MRNSSQDRAKNGASERALVPFLARPKPKIPFHGLSSKAKIFVVKKTEFHLQAIELVSLWQSKCCGRSLAIAQ